MSQDCGGAVDGDRFANTRCCKDLFMPQKSVGDVVRKFATELRSLIHIRI